LTRALLHRNPTSSRRGTPRSSEPARRSWQETRAPTISRSTSPTSSRGSGASTSARNTISPAGAARAPSTSAIREENVVELIARPQVRPKLSLAEVGLPVDDVPAAVDALQRAFDLPTYDDWDESFAPLGDDDGLLIVVRVGRGWFPVGVPSGPAPIEVTLTGMGTGEVELPGSHHRVIGT